MVPMLLILIYQSQNSNHHMEHSHDREHYTEDLHVKEILGRQSPSIRDEKDQTE
jgi:hypothetical protein